MQENPLHFPQLDWRQGQKRFRYTTVKLAGIQPCHKIACVPVWLEHRSLPSLPVRFEPPVNGFVQRAGMRLKRFSRAVYLYRGADLRKGKTRGPGTTGQPLHGFSSGRRVAPDPPTGATHFAATN